MTSGKEKKSSKKSWAEAAKEAIVMPRFWHGMTMTTWSHLLWRNRCAVALRRVPMVAAICGFSVFNSVMRKVQQRVYGAKLDSLRIEDEPLFILGHWRSGTTLLDELLVLDRQHTYPTTYQCFAPHHFLVTQEYVQKWFGFVLPSRRPMDNMKTGWERPQEDEFALCNLGIPSPYLWIAFPNRPRPYLEYLTMQGLSEEQVEEWKSGLQWFLRRISFGDSRRIVLKSPTHTGRVRVLRELFPRAKFVHIVRDPYAVFPSTVRLWDSLTRQQALQVPRFRENKEEFVFDCFERMYRRFEADRELLEAENFVEVRYEDLVADPMGEVKRIYEKLGLGDFDAARPGLEKYLEDVKDYRTNKHELAPELRDEIKRRLGKYMQRYGYCLDTEQQPVSAAG